MIHGHHLSDAVHQLVDLSANQRVPSKGSHDEILRNPFSGKPGQEQAASAGHVEPARPVRLRDDFRIELSAECSGIGRNEVAFTVLAGNADCSTHLRHH